MSSSDGFCSALSFSSGELGQVYTGPVPPLSHQSTATLSGIARPPTPVQPSPVRPNSTILASPAAYQSVPAPPASPARTSSAGSIATPSPAHPSTATVINNPTPTLGSVPLVTAANPVQPPPLPFSSPPQTPMSVVSQSSVSGSALGKRDSLPASESDREETKDKNLSQSAAQQQQPQSKKRRVAPTLISTGTDVPSNDPSRKPDAAG